MSSNNLFKNEITEKLIAYKWYIYMCVCVCVCVCEYKRNWH